MRLPSRGGGCWMLDAGGPCDGAAPSHDGSRGQGRGTSHDVLNIVRKRPRLEDD